ncbi:MAG: hypothetical protein ACR2QU_09560 [Gammaproteobacteria bacterium]
MATKTELVNRTLRLIGVTRFGQATEGTVLEEVLGMLDDYLLSLNEENPLDFDPTEDDVPDERMFHLVMLLAQLAGPGFGKPFNDAVVDKYERKLFAAILGPSDHVESGPQDF